MTTTRKWVAGLAAIAVLVLSGCSNGEEPAAPEPEPGAVTEAPPEPTGPREAQAYGTLEGLRDAAISTGYECPSWQQKNHMPMAAGSGSCSGSDVFSIYANEEQVNAQIEETKRLLEGLAGFAWLVGPNWIINSDAESMERLRAEMGGVIVIYETTGPADADAPTATIPFMVTSEQELKDLLADGGLECGEEWLEAMVVCGEPDMMLFYDPWAPDSQDLMESTERMMDSLYASEGGAVYRGGNWLVGLGEEASNEVRVMVGP